MKNNENLKSALGIEVGDIVWTSYGSNKYEVIKVAAPARFRNFGNLYIYIYSQPITSLVCNDLGSLSRNPSYLNDIRQVGDRYFSAQNDEIFVEKPQNRKSYQLDLFDSFEVLDEASEYPFQKNVDYKKGAGLVWNCNNCGLDFNTQEKKSQPCYSPCQCTFNLGTPIFYFEFPVGIPSCSYPSPFICSLNNQDYKPSKWSKNFNE